MKITLLDGSELILPEGSNAFNVAEKISPRLAKDSLAALENGNLVDLMTPLHDGSTVQIITKKNLNETEKIFRHSLAHVLTQAVEELYVKKGYAAKQIKRGVGPATETGFYQDFDLPEPLKEEEFEDLEKIMLDILKRDLEVVRKEITAKEAKELFSHDPYKLELIDDLGDSTITIYSQGNYVDLCRGPHFPRTSLLPKHFKIESTSSAYWRGSDENPILQRIYGVAFATKEELERYIFIREEAKKRDHRRLGKELELFTIDGVQVGKGLILWMPNGTVIRDELIKFMREQLFNRGYQGVVTPHIAKVSLYETSGHYPYYSDSQFNTIEVDSDLYMLKPMNCPHHMRIFGAKRRSYRELPLKLAEFGTVYRYEMSGELTGLTRVRGFTQDDAHIFCTPQQIKSEFLDVLDLATLVLRTFGMTDVRFRVGTRDPNDDKYIGEDAYWEMAEGQIIEAVEEVGLPYTIEPGDAAFYGPKLDFVVKDVLGREWQLGTIQVDPNLPKRFELTYIGEDGKEHTPIVIHRAPFGSLERFMGILIEHYAGDFPFWLAPRQIMIVPISDRHLEHANKIRLDLHVQGLRVEVNDSAERMNAKIRDAQMQKIPMIFIIGDQEVENNTISLRERTQEGTIERKGINYQELKAELISKYKNRN